MKQYGTVRCTPSRGQLAALAIAAGSAALLGSPPAVSAQDAEGEASEVTEDETIGTGPVVVHDGHVDIGPRFVDGDWTVMVRDDTVEPSEWRHLQDVVLQATDEATVEVPDDPDFAFLGEPGDEVWLLPQVQDLDILWPGWNTQEPEVATTVNREVTWRLHDVDGPGELVLFVNEAFGQPAIIFDSREPYPQELGIEAYTHAHGNWTFTQPGVYLLGIEMSAATVDGGAVTATGVVQFAVGDETDTDEVFAAGEAAEPPEPTYDDAGSEISDDGSGSSTAVDDATATGETESAAGNRSNEDGDGGSSDGGTVWALIAAAALGVAGAGAGFLVWARRRRNQQEATGAPGETGSGTSEETGSDASEPGATENREPTDEPEQTEASE